jgi:hypothetical protein
MGAEWNTAMPDPPPTDALAGFGGGAIGAGVADGTGRVV